MKLVPVSQPDASGILGPVTITPNAGLVIASEINRWQGKREVAFAATWNPVSRQIVNARVIGRGSGSRVPVLIDACVAGEIVLHNHPDEAAVMPSDADIDLAMALAKHGIGCGLITRDLASAYLLLEPHRIESAPYRARSWSVGRFTLLYATRRKAG